MAQEIPSHYDPTTVEDRWNQVWEDAKAFRSVPDDREPYTVVIPPPNVTGVLHMGHMLNNTIQDVLVRRARMQGKNACWVPGTDHASIATEAKVVRKLRDQGIKKSDLSRDAFLEHAWDWTREHGGIILKQLRKLGASCDWDRTNFTLDEHYSRSVIDTFLDLHAKGHIYRGLRMVNWDPRPSQPSPTRRSSTPRSSPSSTTCATKSKARTTGSPSPRPGRRPSSPTRPSASIRRTNATPTCTASGPSFPWPDAASRSSSTSTSTASSEPVASR